MTDKNDMGTEKEQEKNGTPENCGEEKTFLLLSTTICIWNMALEMMTISTIWATVVSVR